MSQENVEIVRRFYDIAGESGFDASWAAAWESGDLHEDFDLTFTAGPQAGTHKGREQVQAALDDILEGFETWTVEPLEFIGSGDQVVAIVNNRFRPKGGTGGEFEYRNGQVWTVRDGMILSGVGYPTPGSWTGLAEVAKGWRDFRLRPTGAAFPESASPRIITGPLTKPSGGSQ